MINIIKNPSILIFQKGCAFFNPMKLKVTTKNFMQDIVNMAKMMYLKSLLLILDITDVNKVNDIRKPRV